MICAQRCRTPVTWKDGELVDEATGFPHDLTCPKSSKNSGHYVGTVVSYCVICGTSQLHQRVSNRRSFLRVCIQCGHGELFPVTQRTASGQLTASRH